MTAIILILSLLLSGCMIRPDGTGPLANKEACFKSGGVEFHMEQQEDKQPTKTCIWERK